MDDDAQPDSRAPGRVPPHNFEAEESLLGAMLLSSDAIRAADRAVTSGDFYKPVHRTIFAAIMLTFDERQSVDPVSVSEQLRSVGALGEVSGLEPDAAADPLKSTRRVLMRLQASTPASANAAHYASIVAELAAVRRAIRYAGELEQTAYDAANLTDPVGDLVSLTHQMAERIGVPNHAVEGGIDALDLVDMEFPRNFIVPGILQRRDRLILTGLEGHSGKTEFLVQSAVQMACGIHPWTREVEYEPLRVLYVDCENRYDQLQPRVQRLMRVAGDRLHHGQLTFREVNDVNVRTPRGANLFDSLCEQYKPDVLITGALYAMFQGSKGQMKHSEEVAEEVAAFFRRLIHRHNCALMIEAHAPHGTDGDRANLRPIGASLWMRWPEIGVGLAPLKVRDTTTRKLVVVPGKFTFDFWRGTRDQDLRRPWPDGVQRWKTWSFIPTNDEDVY